MSRHTIIPDLRRVAIWAVGFSHSAEALHGGSSEVQTPGPLSFFEVGVAMAVAVVSDTLKMQKCQNRLNVTAFKHFLIKKINV